MNRLKKRESTTATQPQFSITRIRGLTVLNRRITMDKIHRIVTILLAIGNLFIAIAAIRDGLVAFFDEEEATPED